MNEPTENPFDRSQEGRETVALLRRHAPPPPDGRAGAEAVLKRLEDTAPTTRLFHLRWIAPLAGAAAAVVVVALVVIGPEQPPQSANPAPEVAKIEDDADRSTVVRPREDFGEITARVRGADEDGFMIDAGLRHGLRAGDELTGPGGAIAKVRVAGIFNARVRVVEGRLAPGDRLRAPVTTDAQVRAARFEEYGGDPGAFYRFGAVVGAMDTSSARMAGIANGEALRVDEVIPALLIDGGVTPTLAAQLGLQRDDVLLEVNGNAVHNNGDLAAALGWSLDPNLVTVTVLRNGRQLDLRFG